MVLTHAARLVNETSQQLRGGLPDNTKSTKAVQCARKAGPGNEWEMECVSRTKTYKNLRHKALGAGHVVHGDW